MRRLLFILLAIPTILCAKPVNPITALQVAQNFINSTDDNSNVQSPRKQRRLVPKSAQVTDNQPYYIFNSDDNSGFVIVSGDDCATPILGYSTEGCIDFDNLPVQLEALLQAYADEIQYATDNNLQATDSITNQWNTYRKAPQNLNNTAVVRALISTTWDQAPRYNNKCPYDASLSSLGGHPTTGCVATAMAQIMKYWGYPSKGTGNKSYKSDYYGTLSANFAITTYDWANMPLKLSASTSSTQNNAVATLMYHCGVAVEMNYNSKGEGSSSANVLDYGGGASQCGNSIKNLLRLFFNIKRNLEFKYVGYCMDRTAKDRIR